MLKGIVFHLAPEVVKSQATGELIETLKLCDMDYILSSETSSASLQTMLNSFSLPPENFLVLTDSYTGISSAKAVGIPCIGYIPPGSLENMSDAYALFEDFASIDVGYLCRTHAHAIGYPADILTTERLMVREFSKEDFPALYSMCTEPATASFMEEILFDYETEQEKHSAYIRNIYPFFDLALWGVYEKASGKLIGKAGFSLPEDDSGIFSIGYLIDVPYRRRGYAKELIPALLSYAKEQGHTKISARIKKENIGSVMALSQCGFPYKCEEYPTKSILTYIIHLTV